MELIAKTFMGLETVLATELIELGANDIQIGNRMVSFTGDMELMYRANFSLHTALRILMPVKHFIANEPDQVYNMVKDIEWERYMDVKTTFAVDANVFSNDFRHSQFVAYRVKDAIVDRWRDITDGQQRPNVRITNPDMRIDIHIAQNDVTISLDSSGESLHRRGYRQEAVQAPLNEVLAAGIIKMTGWKGDCDFIDPMCGSGTLPIEAALIARHMAPGIFRQDYAFMHWRDFDEDLWQSVYDDDSNEVPFEHHIYGYDINRNAVQIANTNVKAAGMADIITIEQRDIADFVQPAEKSIMVTNPPYGARIGADDLMGLYATIGTQLKQHFAGNDAYVLSSNLEAFDNIGLKPSTKTALLNGSMEVELRKYQMFSGRYADMRAEGGQIKTAAEKAHNARRKTVRRRDEGDDDLQTDRRYDRRYSDRKMDRREFADRRNSDRKPGAHGNRFDRNDRRDGDRRSNRFDRNDRRDDDRRSNRFDRNDRRDDDRRSNRFDRNDRRDGDRRSNRFDRNDRRFGAGHDDRRPRRDSDRRDSDSWEAQRHRKMREMREFLDKNSDD